MGVLSHEEILELHGAIVSARLSGSRTALLAGLDVAFVASLPSAPAPGEQMLADLDALNAAAELADGTVPLAVWVRNAFALAASRSEAATFRRALDMITRGRPGAASLTTRGTGERGVAFEMIHRGPDGERNTTNATELMALASTPSPYRDVCVGPCSGTGRLFAPSGISRAALDCQILTQHNTAMFPMMDLRGVAERHGQGLFWKEDNQAGYPGYPGHMLRFAMGFDGSFAYREWVRETRLPHPIWGLGIGLFTCLDRAIGGMLFARRMVARNPGVGRMRLSLSLCGVERHRLAFDFEGENVRGIHLSRRDFVCEQGAIRVEGEFDPGMNDADVLAFAAKLGEDLVYYFQWDWQDAMAKDQLRDILENARNR